MALDLRLSGFLRNEGEDLVRVELSRKEIVVVLRAQSGIARAHQAGRRAPAQVGDVRQQVADGGFHNCNLPLHGKGLSSGFGSSNTQHQHPSDANGSSRSSFGRSSKRRQSAMFTTPMMARSGKALMADSTKRPPSTSTSSSGPSGSSGSRMAFQSQLR